MFERIKSLTIFLFCLCITSSGVKAEEVLSWEECVREAKRNHPDLVSAEEVLRQAEADRAIAASGLLPQISSDMTGRTSKTSSGGSTDTYSYGISGKQLLFDGSKTKYEVGEAAAKIESAQYNYQTISSQIILRLRSAFAGLLRGQELLIITEGIAGRRRQNVELVRLRYEGGREHRGSLLTAQANLAQAELEIVQARRNIEVARRRLLKELGREDSAPVGVKGDFLVRSAERRKPDFLDLADSTPFLQKLAAEKEAAGFGLESARANFYPQINASAGAGRSASDWPPDKDEWSAGVSISFPLFEGGERVKKVSRAKSVLRKAEADERSGRDGAVFALEEAWTELQDDVDTVEVRKKFLEAAEERAKIAQEQYSTGLVSFDNWAIIEDELVRARKSFLDARANALVSEAEWIQAKGGTLDYEN